jgi:hypothetical protein
MRVLVVEDERRMAREHPSDVIVLDLRLPGVNGYRLCSTLRREGNWTLLPGTKTITWNGRRVPTRIHQYVAYSGGRILEVALDWYAQAEPTPTAPGWPAGTARRA